VTVQASHFVRAETFGKLGKMSALREPSTGPRCAALGVYNDGLKIDSGRFGQRSESQSSRGRITAGYCHQGGGADALAFELTQPIDCLLDKIWSFVLPVPLPIDAQVLESKVRREIEDHHS
jgi:hypothetical protein